MCFLQSILVATQPGSALMFLVLIGRWEKWVGHAFAVCVIILMQQACVGFIICCCYTLILQCASALEQPNL